LAHHRAVSAPSTFRHAFIRRQTDDRPMDDLEGHGRRTGWLAHRVARCMGLDPVTAKLVAQAAALHDIGKQFVAGQVLHKPGPLDPKERRQVEMHVAFGASVLMTKNPRERQPPSVAVLVALLHHEWWNGRGYPFALRGTAIPLAARITAVADVFDALSTERCYRPAWPLDMVTAYFRAQRGHQFDPVCADAMLKVARHLPRDWASSAVPASGRTGAFRDELHSSPAPEQANCDHRSEMIQSIRHTPIAVCRRHERDPVPVHEL
jgi:putative two-component system response regulator